MTEAHRRRRTCTCRTATTPILKGVSMQLAQGEVVSLLGPSGSGKTTLLRAVAGLEVPHQGTIRIEDQAGLRRRGRRSRCRPKSATSGLVFQSYALWPHKNGVRQRRLRPEAAQACRRRDHASGSTRRSKNLGLGHLGDRLPHQLSGGQQQRVAIARALVYNPPVILMDEPLSNLDAKLREEARAWLRELILKMQLSALVVTHDQNEAMAMSDRILLLNNGVIEQQGTPQEMYGQPTDAVHRRLHGQQQHASTARSARCATARRCSPATAGACGARRAAPPTVGGAATGMIRLERVRLADGAGREPRPAAAGDVDVPGRPVGASVPSAATCGCAPMARRRCRRASTGSRLPRRDLWVF